MMGKIEKTIALVILIILFILSAILLKGYYYPEEVSKTYEVAVIMDNSSEEYWKYFKLGAERAASDNNLDLHFITMPLDMKGEEQLAYMERELENNVDALVITAIDSNIVEEWLKENSTSLPIIAVGDEIVSDKVYSYISADNYAMGIKLAEATAEDGSLDTCYIIYPSEAPRKAVEERYNGLIMRLNELNIEYNTIFMSNGTLDYGDLYLSPRITSKKVIGLTPRITEQLARLKEDNKIYGIGVTDEILKNLEEGRVSKIIAQSEYDVGYLSINTIKGYLEGDGKGSSILEIYEIDKNNMFTMPLEQILFPIS